MTDQEIIQALDQLAANSRLLLKAIAETAMFNASQDIDFRPALDQIPAPGGAQSAALGYLSGRQFIKVAGNSCTITVAGLDQLREWCS